MTTAFVIVQSEWYDSPGIYQLIGPGTPSPSKSDSHMLIRAVLDASGQWGLWVGPIETKSSAIRLTRRIEIHDSVVGLIGLGIHTSSGKKRSAGFVSDTDMTVLKTD
jgi:hypothetical protein